MDKRIELITWNDIRETIKAVNADFFQAIEGIASTENLRLYRIRYPYGTKITCKGRLNIPVNGHYVPIDHSTVPSELKDDLGYAVTPLIMQLSKNAEAFIDNKHNRLIPLNCFLPGDLYGLFSAITPITRCSFSPVWDITSGARSTFMLPKISNELKHRKLAKQLKLHSVPPKSLTDHWDVFREIATRSEIDCGWESEILVFPKAWLSLKNDSHAWLQFRNHLLVASWQQTQHIREQSTLDLIWESVASRLKGNAIKHNSYTLSTAKHILQISSNAKPGFVVSTDDDSLPTRYLSETYLDIYNLDKYYPTILAPSHKRRSKTQSVYYSFSYPTLADSSPLFSNTRHLHTEQDEIKKLVEIFEDVIMSDQHLKSSSYLLEGAQFNFVYANPSGNDYHRALRQLNGDKQFFNFNYLSPPEMENRSISLNNAFLKSCVQIRTAEDNL